MSKTINKTLEEIITYLTNIVNFEKYSYTDGFLQKINIPLKLLSIFILIIYSVLSHKFQTLILLYLFSLFLAFSSRISFKEFFLRTWIFIPLFTLVISIPAIFSIITPGKILFTINIPFSSLSITYEGLLYTSIFVFRVAVAISLLTLLLLTTRWDDILLALENLKFPKISINILNMTYRYIVLLLNTSYNMLLSRRSRTIGDENLRASWKWGSDAVGAMFMKTYTLGNMVYLSMVSRGFSGEIVSNQKVVFPHLRDSDLIFLFIIIFICIIVMYMEMTSNI